MRTRIVTISHAWGAGGAIVGRGVADRLGFRYIDEEIIALAADKEGLDPAIVADAEQRKTFLDRIVDGLGEGPVLDAAGTGGIFVPDAIRRTTPGDVRALIIEAIQETAQRGDVVIVSHTASIPLAGRDDLLRVFVTASVETRVARIAERRDGDQHAAAKFIKQSDTARAYYFQLFYEIDLELPTHYDLVVNTDALTLEESADIVVAAARRRA